MKGKNGTRLLSEDELKDLEGKVENATPLGLPVTYLDYVSRFGSLDKLVRDNAGSDYLHFCDGVKELDGKYLSEEARFYVDSALDHHIRLAYNVPAEADSYDKSIPKIIQIPTGVIISVGVKYYKTNISEVKQNEK